MTRRMIERLVVVAVVAVVSVWVSAQTVESPLDGAWALQDMSYAKTPAFTMNKPTGLLVVSGNHFATVSLMDSSPRTEIGPDGSGAKTIDEMRATWGPVRAQAGTLQVSGDKVTWRPSVAKGAEPMASGAFSEDTFTVKGDSLVLVSARNLAGAVANPATRRFTRAK